MGADHKGPLAAFVVIAVVAAIVLVTSVRSQAVEALTTVGHHLDRAVGSGVDVVERTVSTAPAPPRASTPAAQPAGHPSRSPLPARGGHAHQARADGPTVAPVTPVDPVAPVDVQTTAPGAHLHRGHHGPAATLGHGHHLGWSPGGPPGHGPAQGHAQGHAHGHSQSHGHGHAYGHAHS